MKWYIRPLGGGTSTLRIDSSGVPCPTGWCTHDTAEAVFRRTSGQDFGVDQFGVELGLIDEWIVDGALGVAVRVLWGCEGRWYSLRAAGARSVAYTAA